MLSGKEIREKRKSLGLSAEELSLQLNVSKDNLYKWEKGHLPSNPVDYMKLQNWLSGKVETVPQETIASEPETVYNKPEMTIQALFNLTESNRLLAESNKTLADSHQVLVGMVQKSTANAPLQSPVTDISTLSDLLGLIAEVGSGKRWRSLEEAAAELHRRFDVAAKAKKVAGTQIG